jgi:hypothetical protein
VNYAIRGWSDQVEMTMSATFTAIQCYHRAADARAAADAAGDPGTKADFLDLERRWLILARNYESQISSARQTDRHMGW